MQQQMRQFLPATAPVQEDGWLSPDGVYYPCGFYNHYDAALEIAGISPSDLEERGWVHISGGQVWSRRGPTQSQIDMLFDMQMLNPESAWGVNIAGYLRGRDEV